jgi:hypothetical protein
MLREVAVAYLDLESQRLPARNVAEHKSPLSELTTFGRHPNMGRPDYYGALPITVLQC